MYLCILLVYKGTYMCTSDRDIHTKIYTYIYTFPYINNCSIAVGTAGSKHLLVVSLTVRLAIVAVERICGQLFVALDAGEMLNVPRLVHRCDHLPQDRLIAGSTGAL